MTNLSPNVVKKFESLDSFLEDDDFSVDREDDNPLTEEILALLPNKDEEKSILTYTPPDPSNTRDEVTQSRPELVVTATPGRSHLRIEGREISNISPETVAQVAKVAIDRTGRSAHEVTLHIDSEGFTFDQVNCIRTLGVAAVYWGSFLFLESIYTPVESGKKQHKLNEDLLTVEDILSGKIVDDKEPIVPHHGRWLRSVDRYIKHLIIEEAKHGLEGTVDLLEIIRTECIGVIGTLPNTDGKMSRQYVKFITEYAGVLARLSGCTNLRDYNRHPSAMNSDTIGRDRNDDLFEYSLKMYKEAEEMLIGKEATEEVRYQTVSGEVQAHVLRAEYLDRLTRGEKGLNNVIDLNRARVRLRRKLADEANSERNLAIQILNTMQDTITSESILTLIAQQRADIENHVTSGGTADKVLLEVAKAAA